MSDPNISINGTAIFNNSAQNAGLVTYGEFSQSSINFGTVAISALFTGSAVNSGVVGDYEPFNVSMLVMSSSSLWDIAYNYTFSEFISASDPRLSDSRTPLAHTQAISTIDGLYDVLTTLAVVSASSIVGFDTAVDARADARITAAAGVSIASLVDGVIPSAQLPSYVDDVLEYADLASFPIVGEAGKVYVAVDSKKIYRWSGSVYIEISPSPGSTDSVTEGSINLYFTTGRAASAAPVQSVAGKTGAVTLSSSDIQGLSAAIIAYAPTAPDQLVQSVAGRTGAVSISAADVAGLLAVIAANSAVTSVAGRTGAVTVSAADVAGFSAAADARINAFGAAPLASPAFTGTPTATTAAAGTNNTQLATTSFVITNRGDRYLSTSTSTMTIDNGSGKTMTIDTGLSYTSQQDITVVFNAANHMHGVVISYNAGTGVMIFDVNNHTGNGSHSAWTVNVGGLTNTNGTLLASNNLNDVSSASAALVNLGGVSTSAVIDITHGGTNSVTAAGALSALGALASSLSAAAYGVASLDGSGKVPASQSLVISVAGKTNSVTLSTSDIQGFNTNAAALAPVQSVAGKTGAVTLSTSDINGFNVNAAALAPVQSVAGKTGVVTLSTSDIQGLSAAVVAYAPVASVAGKTGIVTLSTSNILGFNVDAAALAPVQSVAGKTGVVTLSTSNILGFNVDAAALAPVRSVAGRTGAVVLSAADVVGLVGTYLSSTNFTSVTATSLTLGSAMLSTYSTPVTASGDFLVFTSGGKQRLIRVWDFI